MKPTRMRRMRLREEERNRDVKKEKKKEEENEAFRDRRYRLSTIVLHYRRHHWWQSTSRRQHRPVERIRSPAIGGLKWNVQKTTRGDLQLRQGSGKQAIGMFDVLVPGKLVLTLRSTPPFLAESAFALALTILLAAPLIVRVYLLLVRAPINCLAPYLGIG